MATSTRDRRPTADQACVDAAELAREAALEVAPGEVGEHLGYEADDERTVTHHFACTSLAYRGWHWAVTVMRASRARLVTVAETVLLPGDAAVLAPAWVPWEDRLRPGDLGPGDILPPAEDDARLIPGWSADTELGYDPDTAESVWWVAAEAGLGKRRVLSPIGREDATDRWYSGDRGPDAAISAGAPAQCSTCGFSVAMAGAMGRVFAVCANEYAPDDGRVVSLDHGCGAHSEVVAIPAALAERPDPVLDEIGFDLVEVGERATAEPVDEAVTEADEDAEPTIVEVIEAEDVAIETEDVAAEEAAAEVDDVIDVGADVPALPAEVVDAAVETDAEDTAAADAG
jgi:hypothetical protein